MSKPVSIYGGSSRPCSPACALLHAPRCLTASQVAAPVHGVSTTGATTPDPRLSTPAGRPGRRSGVPGSAIRHLEYEISAYGCAASLVRLMANVRSVAQIACVACAGPDAIAAELVDRGRAGRMLPGIGGEHCDALDAESPGRSLPNIGSLMRAAATVRWAFISSVIVRVSAGPCGVSSRRQLARSRAATRLLAGNGVVNSCGISRTATSGPER